MISMLVGRCHVGMTYRQVIRYVISRLKNKESTFWALSKQDRRNLLEAIIKEHKENRELYQDVMLGNI